MIQAVTIDCWGTLLIDGPSSDDRYRRQRLAGMRSVLEDAGIAVAAPALERAYAESGGRLGQVWRRLRDLTVEQHVGLLIEALEPGLPDRLPPGVPARLVEAYAGPALAAPPAVDRGAAGALETLAGRGLALGVVSNTMRTPGTVLRQVLDRFGLVSPLKVLTFSDECGIRKPDPGIFHLTLRQMGVPPEEAVHVGDDPVLDVEGARDAGMRVIQVAADGRATAPVKPDAVITGLAELPAALVRLGP
jgi:putative hydrolase of the HAD superfamily